MILMSFSVKRLLMMYTSHKIQQLLSHLVSIETTIIFTVEVENENRISFLDYDIVCHSDGSSSTTVYCTKTHTEKYLAYDSHRPTVHTVRKIAIC